MSKPVSAKSSPPLWRSLAKHITFRNTLIAGLAVAGAAGARDGAEHGGRYADRYIANFGATPESAVGMAVYGGGAGLKAADRDAQQIVRGVRNFVTSPLAGDVKTGAGLAVEVASLPFRAAADVGGAFGGGVAAGLKAHNTHRRDASVTAPELSQR